MTATLSCRPATANLDTHTDPDRAELEARLAKYGYVLTDEPGVYLEIPIHMLEVDLTYQRNSANRTLVRKIAREWSWVCCGALTVVERDNIYRVIDGGGRVAAARLRKDIGSLPCMVFPVASIQQEAETFSRINKNRNPVHPNDRFKASLVAGDPIAIEVQRLIDDSGRPLSKTSGMNNIACVDTLVALAKFDLQSLQRVWPLMKVLANGHPFHKRLLEGMVYLEHYAVDGQSLLRMPWSGRLRKIGHEDLMQGIYKATNFYAKGGRRVYAEGIVTQLNRGMKRNAWVLDTNQADD